MDANKNKEQSYETIDLRELFQVIWKQKIMIICITLIVAILAGIYSVFMISPVFHSKLNIVMSMPQVYTTRYGDYTLPITANQDYIKLITSNNVLENTIKDMGLNVNEVPIESYRSRISIGTINNSVGAVQNTFEVTVSAGSPEEAVKFAETLYDNYVEFLDAMTKERAISYYYNTFSVQLKSLEYELDTNKRNLEDNIKLLSETPQTINQKEALKELENTIDYVVLENIINPTYTSIETKVIETKQQINSIENSIDVNNGYMEELEQEKQFITKYYETGDNKLESSLIGVVETSVYLPSPPVAPSQKTSPSNTLNVMIGTVLGGMLGVMVVLVKYWFKKS